MCFHKKIIPVKHRKLGEIYELVKVADKNIYCYKVLRKPHLLISSRRLRILNSAIRRFKYEEGKTYKTIFTKQSCSTYYWLINKGIHSYIKQRSDKHHTTVLCMIPKGTRYFKNATQYCSESIKIIRFFN